MMEEFSTMYSGLIDLLEQLPESGRLLAGGDFRRKIRQPNGAWGEVGCLFGTFISDLDSNPSGDIRARFWRTPSVQLWLSGLGLSIDEADRAEKLSDGFGRDGRFDVLTPRPEGTVILVEEGDSRTERRYFDLSPDYLNFQSLFAYSTGVNDYATCRMRYAHVLKTLKKWEGVPFQAERLRRGVEETGAYRLYVVIAGPNQSEWRDGIMGFDNGWLVTEPNDVGERQSDPGIWTKYEGKSAEDLADFFVVRVGETGIHGRVINLTAAPPHLHEVFSDALELFFARNIRALREDARPLVLVIPSGVYTAGRLSSNPYIQAHSGVYDLEMYL